jgi:hypothetical protein
MRTSRVFGIAAALSSIAATGAGAAEFTFDPDFSHTLQLSTTNPVTNLTGSSPTTQYLSDPDGKGAGYAANVVTNGTSAFFFSSAIAAGKGNFARSITELNINFTNVAGPGLKGISSTIFPATFGLYVAPFTSGSGCTGATLPTCPGVNTGLPNFQTLREGGTAGTPFTAGQAGSSFLFEVLVDNKVQRSIGGVVVMQDANIFGNTQNPGLGLGAPVVRASSYIDGIEGNINLLAGALPGFELLVNDPYSLIWGWDESAFSVAFKAGDDFIGSGTVTYRITTNAWGDSRRLAPGLEIDPLVEERSIIAFSCFADPVGRGSTRGSLIPIPVCDDFGGFGGAASRDYRLGGGSIDENGFFSLKSVVPEPDTWAMLIVGFGLIGLSMRRSKKAVPATAS